MGFVDPMKGPAQNWLKQLSRRSDRNGICYVVKAHYYNSGVSVAWQYFHIKKRSDETLIECLHRLNVAGLRAKMPIKDPKRVNMARKYVEHFISTSDNRNLADQLALLGLKTAAELEQTLRTL